LFFLMIETLCYLYFKSISVFIVLKFIDTELSILMDELLMGLNFE
jgi:hypothetical protein